MIPVYRIFASRFSKTAMSGIEAERAGGRWNSPSRPVVYASGSLCLAVLEILVNVDDAELVLDSFSYIEAKLPKDIPMTRVEDKALPLDWRAYEHPWCKEMGDAWLAKAETAVLMVPSAVLPQESNYLLNPVHPDFAGLRALAPRPIDFDPRLISR
ncbi:MAG: RES family NAD+ phosphorylase [Thermodesulfobacteriota bacterium]|nr:RES family NAD+ phosphorylase [Thermodesulfobacteriota bacterium]